MVDTSNRKISPLSRIVKAFVTILFNLSIILGIISIAQNLNDATYWSGIIPPFFMHAVFYYVVYNLLAMILTACVYNHSKRLVPESDLLRKSQGKRLAAKFCLIYPIVWIIIIGPKNIQALTLDNIMMGIICYVVPFVMLRNFIYIIRHPMPFEKAVSNIRRSKNNLSGQRIWLVLNETDGQIKEEYLDFYEYMLSPSEIVKLNQNLNVNMLMQQTWRWCYVISTQDKNELEQIYDRAYDAYNNAGNLGIRKIIIVNIVPSGIKLQLPDKFKRTEYIYYAQVTSEDKIDCSLLNRTVKDVINSYNKGFAMASKKKKQRSGIMRVFLLLRDAYNVRYNYGDMNYFEHSEALLSRILESEEIKYDFKGGDEWLMDFYSSACVFETPERAIMALLDYWELVLRMVAIYYYKRSNYENMPEDKLVHANLMELAKIIQKESHVDAKRHDKLMNKEYFVAELIMGYLHCMSGQLYIKFEGSQVSFLGLVSLVLTIRNKFMAHGVLTASNRAYIWGIIYWATLILNNYLDIEEFQLEEKDSCYEIGYEQKISAFPLVIDKDGMPCIAAIQKSNKKKSYIYVNYFSGELIAPEFVSE